MAKSGVFSFNRVFECDRLIESVNGVKMQEFKLRVFEQNNIQFAELVSEDWKIQTTQDALDLLATAQYEGADHILVYERNFDPAFFDLKTRIAGEILQKCSNYKVKLA